MAQKVNKPAPAPIIITVTLPDEQDKLLRTGHILIQRGTLATFRQFEYTDLPDIMTAIQDSATWLTQVEANPPDVTPAAPRPQAAAASSQTPDEDNLAQQEGEGVQGGAVEESEAADQATGDSQPPPEGEGVQVDQMQLF